MFGGFSRVAVFLAWVSLAAAQPATFAYAQAGGPPGGGGGPGGPGGPPGAGAPPGPRSGPGAGIAPPGGAGLVFPSAPGAGSGSSGNLTLPLSQRDAFGDPKPDVQLNLPPITGYAPAQPSGSLAIGDGQITLSAMLTGDTPEIDRGLVWRVFKPEADEDGKLPLVASAQGGTTVFQLEPGSYLVHAAFGRAGATKRVTVGREPHRESLVLDAGGLKLDAILSGGVRIPAGKLRFSIYEEDEDARGERALIVPDVKPNSVVRLNAGTYHVVSTYGAVNASIRADIRVEAGKLTEATVEHRAAELTMKLVREEGGEAIADTSWSILGESGDIVRESVGAFASMVLAEGDYTIVAKNRDRVYQRDFTVIAGRNQDVEVMAQNGTEVGEGSGD